MKLHFVSFVGEYTSNSKFSKAANALLPMIQRFEIFDTISIYTPQTLVEDTEFKQHLPFIYNNRRGFGYWIWKPYLILKKLLDVEEGDMIFYADICTSLRIEGKERFLEYIETAKNNPYGNLFFPYAHFEAPHIKDWCKMDTIKFLLAEDVMNDQEVIPGILFTTANKENKRLFRDWYTIMKDYHLIDDSPSVCSNAPSFKEHRHDQSIFSILIRKYYNECVSTIYTNELYFQGREKEGQQFPIWIQANHY